MPKGEVYDFASRKRIDSGEEPETLPEFPETLDQVLDVYRLADMLFRLAQVRTEGKLPQRNIDLRRAILRDIDPSVLFTWINRSSLSDWNGRPAFYASVYEELRERGLTSSRPRS